MPLRDDASKISLYLEFEMPGVLASLAFGVVFNQICNTMVSSFTARLKQFMVNIEVAYAKPKSRR